MSKKSKPGDGVLHCGTKGGSLYGGHMAVRDIERGSGFLSSFVKLARTVTSR
jgi:hypothetical protein